MYDLVNKIFTEKRLKDISSNESLSSAYPAIVIARDPGSGGKPIASLIARKLNFDFYDDALLEEIAKSAKRRKSVIQSVDERTRSLVEDIVHNLINPDYISDSSYLKHLINTTLTLAQKGNCVIVGRGANFIIPIANQLSVMVTASKETRIRRAIYYEEINESEAKKRIEKITAERKQFVSQYFNKDYANPKYYDVIINTEYFDVESASDIIISAFRKKFPTVKEIIKTTIKKTGKLY